MIARGRIDQDLKFLISEVETQLKETEAALRAAELPPKLSVREDRINNLTVVISRKAFELAPEVASDADATVDMLQAYAVIAANLESLADHCMSVVEQSRHIEEEDELAAQDLRTMFQAVRDAVREIPAAVFDRDVDAALRLCQAEDDLDHLYARGFHTLLEALQEQDKGESAQTLVTIIFILRYLERMGDALLNVGEAVLGVCVGEPIKISRLRALEESLESGDALDALGKLSLRPMPDTRSGCRISRVDGAQGSGPVIFKQGNLAKLEAEKRSSEAWQKIRPGLAPTVQGFQQTEGDHGAIVLDYLPGKTLEEIVLEGTDAEVDDALARLLETLTEVWTSTRVDQELPGKFVAQLMRRLPDVYAIHPGFDRGPQQVGGHLHPSLDQLLERAGQLEATIPAPFAVFGHGDFNIDNILINAEKGQVHFIDLHRSRMMDYVQDVAVFLVSNHRLQVFDAPKRARLARVKRTLFDHAQAFARSAGDATFEARLALGLARNLATSSRFVLVPWFARSMFLRASYLLARLLEAPDPASFRLPLDVLND